MHLEVLQKMLQHNVVLLQQNYKKRCKLKLNLNQLQISLLFLPENLRNELKIPLGQLIKNSNPDKEKQIRESFGEHLVITVGDATSQLLLNMGLIPFLHIIDGQEKRQKCSVPLPVEPKDIEICREIHTKNNAGEISDENFDLIKNIFDETPRTPVRLLVDGEEDLLVLPVCLFAPENSVVMYGQPNEGLVIAEITDEVREKVQKIVNQMK